MLPPLLTSFSQGSQAGRSESAHAAWHERWATAPGNVALPSGTAGLTKDSVVNVSQLLTVDRAVLGDGIGNLAREQLIEVDRGLRLSLNL